MVCNTDSILRRNAFMQNVAIRYYLLILNSKRVWQILVVICTALYNIIIKHNNVVWYTQRKMSIFISTVNKSYIRVEKSSYIPMVFRWKFNRLFSFGHYCCSNILFCKCLRSRTIIKQKNEIDNLWRRNALTMRIHKIRHNILASIYNIIELQVIRLGRISTSDLHAAQKTPVNCTTESYSGWVVLEEG